MNNTRKIVGYFFVLIVSVFFLYFGNQLMSTSAIKGMVTDRDTDLDSTIYAKITNISKFTRDNETGCNTIYFTAKTVWSKNSGKEIQAKQMIYENYKQKIEEVSIGDTVILLSVDDKDNQLYIFQDYFRIDNIIILGVILCISILILGGIKGFHTLVSLTFTCLSIFLVFIPSIGAGVNIYFSCILICIFIVFMSMLILNGFNKKTLTASLGCLGGVIFSGIITKIMDSVMKMTGFMNEDTFLLVNLFGSQNIDMRAIIFAMTTIGVLGASMDVSISITSSIFEIHTKNPNLSKYDIVKSGLNIGRDIMGTMMNTLILAYIGSSLIVVLLYYGSHYPLLGLLNKEEIIFEFLQSLTGSMGMVFNIPFTTLIAAFLLSKSKRKYT